MVAEDAEQTLNHELTGGSGGSGVVVVRYKIGSIQTAKATGGAISFYGGKTIHAFTGSGTFATTSDWSAADVEYVVAGGGGGGGVNEFGGGGGAGAYRTGTTPIGAHPVSTTIQVGAGAADAGYPAGTGTPSYFGTPITAPGGGSGGASAAGVGGGSGGGGSASGGTKCRRNWFWRYIPRHNRCYTSKWLG